MCLIEVIKCLDDCLNCINFSEVTWIHLWLQLEKYYQPRKSHKVKTVDIKGSKVPLYGAGGLLTVSDHNGTVPLELVFEVKQRGNVVGKLVRSRHRRHVSCSLIIDPHNNKPIKLKQRKSCVYDWTVELLGVSWTFAFSLWKVILVV